MIICILIKEYTISNLDLHYLLKNISKSSKLLETMLSRDIDFDDNETPMEEIKIEIIRTLIQSEIIDYDELEGVLSLEYQTEDFLNYLIGSVSRDTNIESIDKQVKEIERLLSDTKKRIRNNEEYSREKKSITKRLKKITALLKDNYINIREKSVFTFQSEKNNEIKKQHLKNSKLEILALANAIDVTEAAINKKRRSIKKVLANDGILERFFKKIIELRKSIIQTRNDIVMYLNKTIENESLIKKIKRIGALKKQGQLLVKTNILEVIEKYPKIKQKEKLNLHRDYMMPDFLDGLKIEIKKRKDQTIKLNQSLLKQDLKEPIKIKERKTNINIIDITKLYKEFSQQNKTHLVDFIQNQNIDNSKISPLISRIIVKWHSYINIDCINRVKVDNKSYPTIFNNLHKGI